MCCNGLHQAHLYFFHKLMTVCVSVSLCVCLMVDFLKAISHNVTAWEPKVTEGKTTPSPFHTFFIPSFLAFLSSHSPYSYLPPPPPPAAIKKNTFILTVHQGDELKSNRALIVWRRLDPVFVFLSLSFSCLPSTEMPPSPPSHLPPPSLCSSALTHEAFLSCL